MTAEAWKELLKCVIVAYLVFSAMLACYRIARYASWEEMTAKIGEEFFEKPVLFDWLTYVLAPSYIIIYLWIGIFKIRKK